MKGLSAKTILHEIAEQAVEARMLDSLKPKVGKFVLRLSPEKRRILRTLKSEDIKNDGQVQLNKPSSKASLRKSKEHAASA